MNPQNPYQGQPYQQPQQNQPAPQLAPLSAPGPNPSAYPVDYLNQIAPPSHQKTLSKVTVFGLIIGFLAVIGFVLFLMMRGTGTPDITAQTFAARDRAQTLMTVANEQRLHFGTNRLTSLNATLAASLNSMSTTLSTIAGGKEVKNKNKKAIAAEKAYAAALSKKLNDAYLAGTLDRTYATQMAFELRTFNAMINTMRKTSKNAAITKFHAENTPTLNTVIKQLAEYSDS